MDGHKERDTHEDPDTKNAGQTLAKLFNDVSWKPINDCTIGCTTSLNPGLPPVTRSGEPAQRDCVFLTTKMNSLRAMYTEVMEKYDSSGRGAGGSSEGGMMAQFRQAIGRTVAT